jgi:RNA polymerase sigma-70 factor (ECF subfamily)
VLVDRHQQAVRAFLRRTCSARDEAEDLAQETFLAAWSGARGFRGGSAVRSWLMGIAWKKAKSAQRSWFRGATRDTAFEATASLERGQGTAVEDRLALEKAMRVLSLEQRAAVALCLAGDFSHGDAAEALALPLGTVKSHVSRGRAKLLEALGGQP